MREFQPGDIVRLKSGGPDMTVRSVDDSEDTVFCDWFDDEKKHYLRDFPSVSLQKVEFRNLQQNDTTAH